MKLIGTYSEDDFFAKKNKADEAKAEAEEGIKYFFPKFRKRRGKVVVELYGMKTEEYMNSPML